MTVVKNGRRWLTVFTPTYNRAYCLSALYESLCAQTSDDFVWFVVDDGSTDATNEMMGGMIDEGKIAIHYVRTDNSGKHVAHNLAIDECTTPLFVCVDSDDRLTPDAVETIIRADHMLSDETLLGYFFRRVHSDGTLVASAYPRGITRVGISDLYHDYSFTGDTVIVFRASMVKGFQFPVYEGEKFVPENVLYNELNSVAPMALFEDAIYVSDYLPDGLTCNKVTLREANPYGFACSALSEAYYGTNWIYRIKKYGEFLAECSHFRLNRYRFGRLLDIDILTRAGGMLLRRHYVKLL